MKKSCLVLALALLAATLAVAQEQDRLYVQELLRLMEREGWKPSETGELERLMLQHRWQWQISPEPEAVAFALGYARQAGLAADPAETMELALELSLRAAEMRHLGFDARAIARAEADAVREATRALKAPEADTTRAQLRDRLRDRLRDQIQLQEADMLRERARSRAGAGEPGRAGGAGGPGGPGGGRP
jgi:hypothetical protein